MTTLREAAQQALDDLRDLHANHNITYAGTIAALEAALAQQAEPVEPVAGRAFLERILTAMEGVIDVADRKTDEFDALRSCVIDLTLMLHTAPPQRKPLTKEQLLYIYNQLPNWGMDMDRLPQGLEKFARAIERAHGIPMPGDPK